MKCVCVCVSAEMKVCGILTSNKPDEKLYFFPTYLNRSARTAPTACESAVAAGLNSMNSSTLESSTGPVKIHRDHRDRPLPPEVQALPASPSLRVPYPPPPRPAAPDRGRAPIPHHARRGARRGAGVGARLPPPSCRRPRPYRDWTNPRPSSRCDL